MLRLLATLLLASSAFAAVPVDLRDYREGPVQAAVEDDELQVRWQDESGKDWQAVFPLLPEQPAIRSISTGGKTVVNNARPFYQAETGKRRKGWDAFFDYPPSHPDGTRHWMSDFALRGVTLRTVGDRLEVALDRLTMGPFEGELVYTIFPGSRLMRQEARLVTWEADTAYYYDAGLEMVAPYDELPGRNMQTKFAWYDTAGKLVQHTQAAFQPEREPEKVRYRTLAVGTEGGSVAVFPAPHQYFFPRDFTTNLGYLWHRSFRGAVSVGIRQIRDTNWIFYPWMNAPPGTEQRMSLFWVLSDGTPEQALDEVLPYTHRDRFVALPGYKTVSPHWHLAYTVQAMENGFDWTPPFKPVLEDMGVDAAIIMDFHGDGHPRDLTDLRLQELDAYFKACKAQSNDKFLLMPAEEANVHLGGHWGLVFPKPVYWFMGRPEGGAFEMNHPKYGKVYSAANEKEMLEIVRKENGLMYQTHARTKGSTGYPDKIRNSEHFLDDHWFGAGWKAIPSDPSSPHLGDRILNLMDDMAQWGLHKLAWSEADLFQFDSTHELYAHMNINYVKADRLPSFDNYGEILEPIVKGDFFVSTGEVLLPEVSIDGSADQIKVAAEVRWTFPLRMAEVVWGDGEDVHREQISLETTAGFGSQTFHWSVPAKGWKWARLEVWDVAANGAFVNPTWRQ
ncbi:MAG: hypothetical protein R2748_25680 [Bryobacterales bacterium]